MKSDKIQSAIGKIDVDLIEAADQKQPAAKRRQIWRSVGLAAACLALVVMAVSVPKLLNHSGSNPAAQSSSSAPPATISVPLLNEGKQVDYGTWYLLPGGFRPELMVNGKLYYWDRFAYPLRSRAKNVYIDATGDTVLPEGFTPVRELSSVTKNTPEEDGQLKAGFSATGTIFTSEAAPEAVYVLLDADCFEINGPYYIRFVSAAMADGCRIMWSGKSYLISFGDEINMLYTLPGGCVEAGKLHYIGLDLLPKNDLETNCPSDMFGISLEGQEIYFDPAEPEFLYLHQAGGAFEGYLKCPLLP